MKIKKEMEDGGTDDVIFITSSIINQFQSSIKYNYFGPKKTKPNQTKLTNQPNKQTKKPTNQKKLHKNIFFPQSLANSYSS